VLTEDRHATERLLVAVVDGAVGVVRRGELLQRRFRVQAKHFGMLLARLRGGTQRGAGEGVLVVDPGHVESVEVDAGGSLCGHGEEREGQRRERDKMTVTVAGMHHGACFLDGGGITKSPGRATQEVSPTFAPVGRQADRLRTGIRADRSSARHQTHFGPQAMEWPASAGRVRMDPDPGGGNDVLRPRM
jgi:hypothetical protein